MFSAAVIVVFLSLISQADGQVYGYSIHESHFDCTGKDNGVAEIGCDGYVECVNNVAVKHLCTDFEYYDRDSHTCIATTTGHSGCVDYERCSRLDDNSYADPERNCQSYYTCRGHLFFGHQYCPAGLVFNEQTQICDWERDVEFPCGTKPRAAVVG